jgi:hypothetical protein
MGDEYWPMEEGGLAGREMRRDGETFKLVDEDKNRKRGEGKGMGWAKIRSDDIEGLLFSAKRRLL